MIRMRVVSAPLVYLALCICAVIFFFPFYWLLSTSVKPDTQLFVVPPVLIPHPVVWSNYPRMFAFLPFWLFMRNSLSISVLTVIGVLFSCPLAAYSFARLRWPGREVVFLIVLATLMLPSQVTLIPLYLIFRQLGWIDTWRPLWVPAFFGNAFYIFLLRQFFLTIPGELEDAAKIDGAGFLAIYWRIMLPLLGPALVTVLIFTFMGSWNNFLGPLIYINSVEKMPMALALQLFQTLHGAEWGLMMAASTLMTIPPVLLFFFTQRYFIRGIALTGLKG